MKSLEDDFFLGRYLLEHRMVSREILLECLYQVAQDRRASHPRPLGVVLIGRGLITEDQLNRILIERVSPSGTWRSLSEVELGRLLVAGGLISRDKVDECLAVQSELQAAKKTVTSLGELVVERGYVTQPQVFRALAYHRQQLFSCPVCGIQVSLAPPPAGQKVSCRKCGGTLNPADRSEAPAPPSEGMLHEGGEEEDIQVEIDRGVAAYLKQKNLVKRELIREGEQLKTEFSRYGLIVPLLEILRRRGALSPTQKQDLELLDFFKIVQDPDWRQQAIPGYRLLKRIASGGFGAIWEAEGRFDHRRVAIKLLHAGREKEKRSVARFQWEALLLRRFLNTHLVRGIDQGVEKERHFIILERVEGCSLGQALAESGPFPVKSALHAGRQVADGIRYLHGEGYVHGDVKPDNAVVDGVGNVKICDLGFTQALASVGAGAEAEIGADLYSLGVLLYALLTGHDPYAGVTPDERVSDKIESGLPVPNLMLVKAPPTVVRFLKGMMHPDRGKRISRAEDAISGIDRLMAE